MKDLNKMAMEVLIVEWMRVICKIQGKRSFDAWAIQGKCLSYWQNRDRQHLPANWWRAWQRVIHYLPAHEVTHSSRVNANGRKTRWKVWTFAGPITAEDVERVSKITWKH